jgi:cytochrome bd ubiquinol oxidase subunit I
MTDAFDVSLVDWSRAQFALTAMYHWLFVPLTLGLSFIIAFMETIYYKTKDPEWKKITKFWMTLFGINFAIGVATGIILEFEFGTNWSNYSWFVGDIFGAPLAIEGIMAFFMESTFIAVMFFGWKKVSPKFHLVSTWLVAIGANLSALWILVANAWMQSPVGMAFNPDTARNEMVNFWQVLLSPVAVNKFLHTIFSSYTLAAVFVISISAWFLLKGRNVLLAKRSIIIAAVFGLIVSVYTAVTGDGSGKQVAIHQPMKLAAMEGLNNGKHGVPLVIIGIPTAPEQKTDRPIKDIHFKLEVPNLLSLLAFNNSQAYVAGVNDLIDGNSTQNIMPAQEKIDRGKIARNTLAKYKSEKKKGNTAVADSLKLVLNSSDFQQNYFRFFGYGFLNDTNSLIPNIPLSFYSFHIMVLIGGFLIILFIVLIWLSFKKKLDSKRWLLYILLFSLPLPYIAGQAGWILAEVGRQPWVIQDYLPTVAAVSQIDASAVQITFWIFALVFTSLMIAEISIMVKQIKIGPKTEGGN